VFRVSLGNPPPPLSTEPPATRFAVPRLICGYYNVGESVPPAPTMHKLKTVAHKLGSAEAAEIAEAALVLPVVFLFLIGIIWFGRAFNIYSTIQQAAQQGAITAARPTCATCGNTFPTSPYPTVENAIFHVLQANNLDTSTSYIKPNSLGGACPAPTGDNIEICPQVLLNPDPTNPHPQTCSTLPTPSQICGVIVTFRYKFAFSFPFTSLDWSTILLTAQAQSRMEN